MDEFKTVAINMQGYMDQLHSYSLASLSAMNAAGMARKYLPHSPVDVDERVYVELGERDFDDRNDNTMPLASLLAELTALGAKAPKGAEVVIEFGSSGYDGGEYATYEVGYFRDPSEDEKAERRDTNRQIAERDKAREAEAAAKERAEFERLKAKFGD